jgi:hypothetical protein
MQTLERVTSGGIFIMPVKYIPENTLLASGRFHCLAITSTSGQKERTPL